VLAFFLTVPVLADSTDLVMTTTLHGPQYTPAGQLMLLFFTVRNDGPDIARDAKLTIDVPPALTVETIYGVDCDRHARPLQCAVGDIGVGEWRSFEFRMRGPLVNAMYTVLASVSTSTPDREPANNRFSLTYDNRVDVNLVVQMDLDSARVDPGEAYRFPSKIHSYFETVSPRDIRMEYEAIGGTIEKIEALSPWSCTIDGERATCTAPQLFPNCLCSEDMFVTVRTKDDRSGGVVELRATASSNLPNRFPESSTKVAKLEAYRWVTVTTTADAGPGSLRAAIDEVNATCGERACKILFEIPPPVPSEGWFTIVPSEPLPPITAKRVFVDALRQAAITGDTNPKGPEVAIDGRLAHRGLEIHSNCEAVVRGFALGNFDENQALWFSGNGQCPNPIGFDRRVISDNHVGVDPTGTVAWPNLRGLRADEGSHSVLNNVISRNVRSGIWIWRGWLGVGQNKIVANGASGVFIGPDAEAGIAGNTIADNFEMGVAVARGARSVHLSMNSMRNNGGLGLDWGLDGISRSDAPLLLGARVEGERTSVSLQWRTTPLREQFGNSFRVEIFANESPDGEGETSLGVIRVEPNAIDGRTIEVSVNGDHRGKWFTATGTRQWELVFAKPPKVATDSYSSGVVSTSEMSNAVRVP